MFGFSDSLEKIHKKIHEQCYYLIMAQSFYEILDSELNRFQVSKNQRILKIGIDPAMGRDYAGLGIKIMALSKNALESLADIYIAELKENVTNQFQQIYSSNDKKGQSDLAWRFAPMFNGWIAKISKMSAEHLGQLSQNAYAAINYKEAAKIVYKAFEPNAGFKEKGSEEAAQLIHECFVSWSANGWFEEDTSSQEAQIEEQTTQTQPLKENSSYFDELAANSRVSEGLLKMIINIHQTLAHLTSLYVSDDAGSMKQSLETPIQTLVAMDEMICSMAGIPIASNQNKTTYMCNYLSQVVNGSNDLLTYHINKSHAWYLENIQKFSVEVVMEFETKTDRDNKKILELVVDYFQTPEFALSKTSNKIIKSPQDSNLQTFKNAILNYLQMNNIQPIPQPNSIQESGTDETKCTRNHAGKGISDDGAGFL